MWQSFVHILIRTHSFDPTTHFFWGTANFYKIRDRVQIGHIIDKNVFEEIEEQILGRFLAIKFI